MEPIREPVQDPNSDVTVFQNPAFATGVAAEHVRPRSASGRSLTGTTTTSSEQGGAHVNKPWFMGKMERARAEEVLQMWVVWA